MSDKNSLQSVLEEREREVISLKRDVRQCFSLSLSMGTNVKLLPLRVSSLLASGSLGN